MNKLLLIVLLAICLVSVQAFVKRDAPAGPASENPVANIQKQLSEFANNIGAEVQKAFDPEVIKTRLDELSKTVNKAIEDLKPKKAE